MSWMCSGIVECFSFSLLGLTRLYNATTLLVAEIHAKEKQKSMSFSELYTVYSAKYQNWMMWWVFPSYHTNNQHSTAVVFILYFFAALILISYPMVSFTGMRILDFATLWKSWSKVPSARDFLYAPSSSSHSRELLGLNC